MKRLLVIALPLAVVTHAYAQDRGGGRWASTQTKADAEARAEMLFGRLDANHDGFVTKDETDAFTSAMAAATQGDTRISGRIAQMFTDADADHDGRISLAEAKASADRRFDASDTNHDGTITPEERQAARAAMGAQQPQ